jgi:hypothetical protein
VLGYDNEFASTQEEGYVKRVRFIAATLSASAVVASTIGVSNVAASSGVSAKHIVTTALAAARTESGCTYATTFTLDKHSYVLNAQAGSTSGEQLISYNGAQIDVREVDDIVYVFANASGVKLQYGETDPTWANRWVDVTPSDAKFAAFAGGVLLGSTLDEVSPSTLKGSATSETVDGEKVLAVTGKPNSNIGLSGGNETLYLSAKSPYLPLKLVVTDKPTSEVRKLTITFASWGKKVVVSKPAKATALSKTNLSD